jgi:uncharacterized protein (TIGR03086 family)
MIGTARSCGLRQFNPGEEPSVSENGTMDRDLLDRSHQALRAAVLGVAPQDWSLPTPCDQWNVTQVLQHAAGDQLAYVAAITGGPGPPENPFAPSGQLDRAPLAVADQALQAAADAWATVADDDPGVPTPLPQGALPAWLAAGACALDAAVHAWDIAQATGQRSPLTPAVARPLMAVATQIVEPLRGFAYAPALDGRAGGDDAALLLRYLGRRPDWTSS